MDPVTPMALLLEREAGSNPPVYRGRSRELTVSAKVTAAGTYVTGRTDEGEPVFEWTEQREGPHEEAHAAALRRLCEQEEVEAVVLFDASTGKSTTVRGRLRAPLPPEAVPEGVVAFPPFPGPYGADTGQQSGAFVQVEAQAIRSIEYLRVGRHGGASLIVIRDEQPVAVPVGVEPGAVLMRIWHVDPEQAYRLGAERPPSERPT